MKEYNFDLIIDRKNTNSIKWDFLKENNRNEDTLAVWVADMDLVGCKEVSEAINNASKNAILGYTDTKNEYFDVVSDWYKKYFDFYIKKESFIMSPGVVYSVNLAVKAFTKENDAILFMTPSYPPFKRAIVNNNRKAIESDLILVNDIYQIDFDDIERKIIENDVKMLIFCSPHNPSGRVWTKEEIKKIGDICLKYNVIVFSDEIHSDFTYKNYKHYMFTSIDDRYKNNTIIALAPSKTFNIAGLQTSYAIIENESLREKFIKELDSFGFHTVNMLGQVASFACYKYGRVWLEELKEYLEANLNYFKEAIKQLKGIKLIEPQGTYLLWLDMSELALGDKLYDKIKEECRLWVNEGNTFGESYSNFIRINIATQKSVLVKVIERLKLLCN